MFSGFYISRVLCSKGPMFSGFLYFQGPIFQGSMFQGPSILVALGSHRILCS